MVPRLVVGVIVMKDGMVLLGQRKDAERERRWAFPGGDLEYGEAIEACACRYLTEGTGLKVLSLQLGPWVSDMIDGNEHEVTLFVFVDAFEGDVQCLEKEKHEVWQWFSWESLPSSLFPSVQSLLKKIESTAPF